MVEVLPVQGKEDIDVLHEAIARVEERIIAALRSMNIPYAAAKTHIYRFRDYLRFNFWDVDTGKDSGSSGYSTTFDIRRLLSI